MTRFARRLLIASVLVVPLAGCSTYDTINDSLDPSEWLSGDWFGLGAKKKLQGERKAVFPEGVPGVTRGVPPELVKGNQAAEAEQQAAAVQEEEPQPPPPKPKAKPKPKPKAATAAVQQRTPTSITVRRPPAEDQPQAPAQQQSGAVAWPDPPGGGQQTQRAPTSSGGVQWPDPPPLR
jgi:hypothetical protein